MNRINNVNNQTQFQGLPKIKDGKALKKQLPEFLEKINSATDIEEVYTYLDKCSQTQNSLMSKLDNNLYRFKDYVIRIGMSFNTDSLTQTLKDINKLDLNCAPKYISSKYFNDGSSILVTKIKTLESDLPMKSFNKVKHEIPLDSKNKFLEDVEKLLNNDMINPAIAQSTQNWYVIPGSNRIYIDNWEEIKPVYSSIDKNKVKKVISKMCGLIYD